MPDYGGRVNLGVSPEEFLTRIRMESPVPARVGWTDVEQVRTTTRALATSENLFGGGLSCDAAAGQLRWAGRLLKAQASNDTKHALLEAVGNLAGVVAFSAFDVGDHQAAARCFQFALWCADEGNSWPLRAATLADMTRQAVYLNNMDDALSLIEYAQVRADRLTATGRAMIWTVHARLLAIIGRHAEARDEVQRADAYFADHAPAEDPPWLVYYDRAEHQGTTARALIPAAVAERRPEQTLDRLVEAVALHSDSYPRSRAFSRTRLAALLMTVGDPREAAAVGHLAIADAAGLHSRRITDELRALDRAAERHGAIAEVAELHHALGAVT
ncbi:tetratricopeptide (TPR) repeat protein [Kutzneria viridogrisea]|uniref:Tetratricopeptide (TPR) repeat protein n=1 Tax=Kutzneria viridogrisea TaxID=47990 RepID=A0ABR6BBK0_9PSEU|nr:tetratricopeptide (TPR) repeat protein [Kutzneria viridogrisea]